MAIKNRSNYAMRILDMVRDISIVMNDSSCNNNARILMWNWKFVRVWNWLFGVSMSEFVVRWHGTSMTIIVVHLQDKISIFWCEFQFCWFGCLTIWGCGAFGCSSTST